MYFHICSWEIIDIFPHLTESLNVSFFMDTVKARSFKPCMIITFLCLPVRKVYLFSSFRFGQCVCSHSHLPSANANVPAPSRDITYATDAAHRYLPALLLPSLHQSGCARATRSENAGKACHICFVDS